MKRASILLQIILLTGGLVALAFYVYPEFTKVNESQNLSQEYTEAINEAEELRNILSNLQNRRSQVSAEALAAVERYLPQNRIDQIAIQRDILAYVQGRDLQLQSLNRIDSSRETIGNVELQSEQFGLTVTGEYDEVRGLLADFERNNYPLRLSELSLSSDALGAIQATIRVNSYWYPVASDSNR